MKIVVCIKEVLDVTFPFALDPQGLRPLEEDVFRRANPADCGAVEVALSIREKLGGEVVLLGYGPQRVESTLRDCLAMGADRAVRVWDERVDAGSQAKAHILARAVQALGADLVLCGARSLDEGSGETPAALAEFLGFAQVTAVTDLEIALDGKKATASRKLEKGRRVAIECPLPAVLALEEGVQQPRYAALSSLLEAKRAQVDLLDQERLGLDAAEVRRLDSLRRQVRRALPRPRPKKTFNLESGLTAEQRMELMMSGGARQSKSDLLEGSPQDVGRKLADILQEKVLKKS
ncbi:MAG: electron transfer flavoprotein subunit beta/FixA family protein [Desulfuromonadales bacterium]|nr:electron transfer flavoprotein subunit beta/FixA family protein [Desulfuromonadales bacterium]